MHSSTEGVKFVFNKIIFSKIDGISMGSFMGLELAFVGLYEHNLFESCHTPSMYLRYAIDTFSVYNSFEEAGEFHLKLNSLHPFLRLTMELENVSALPFLDVLVEREQGSFINQRIS